MTTTSSREWLEKMNKYGDLSVFDLCRLVREGELTTGEFTQLCELRKSPQLKARVQELKKQHTALNIQLGAVNAGRLAAKEYEAAAWRDLLHQGQEEIAKGAIEAMSAVLSRPTAKPKEKTAAMDDCWQKLLIAYNGDESQALARLEKSLEREPEADPVVELRKSGDQVDAYFADYLTDAEAIRQARADGGEKAVAQYTLLKKLDQDRQPAAEQEAMVQGQWDWLEKERKPWLKAA